MAGRREEKKMFTDIGIVGRRTGLTVGADLVTDDDGMENMSAFFSPTRAEDAASSPLHELQNVTSHSAVSSPREDYLAAGDVTQDDTTMDIDENSGRAPRDVLASRRKGVDSPRARASLSSNRSSPFTKQSASRRRQESSPLTPNRRVARPALSKSHRDEDGNDDDDDDEQPAIIENPQNSMSPAIPDADVEMSDDGKETTVTSSHVDDEPPRKAPARNKKPARRGKLLTSTQRKQPVVAAGSEEPEESVLPPLEAATPEKEQSIGKAKKRKSEEVTVSTVSKNGQKAVSGSRKRPRKGASSKEPVQNELDAQLASATTEAPSLPEASSSEARGKNSKSNQVATNTKGAASKQPKPRGRPAGAKKVTKQPKSKPDVAEEIQAGLDDVSDPPASSGDDDEPIAPSRQRRNKSKPSRGTSRKDESDTHPSSSTQPPVSMKDASNHNNNAKQKRGRKRKERPHEEEVTEEVIQETVYENNTKISLKHRPRTATQKPSIITLPDATDTDENADGKRRSKRIRTKPFKFWKGERMVYTVTDADKSAVAHSVVRQVVQVPDTPVNVKRATKKHKSSHRSEIEAREESEEPEPEDEEWELSEKGCLTGMVKQYADPAATIPEDDGLEEIATSRHKMITKPVFNHDYTFYKTLGKEFMGAGIIEMQPGSSKKMKSSNRMQLVFYLVSGKVEAVVNNLGFRIGVGGQFQVPPGNMYSMSNPFDKPAKLFFAQACEPFNTRKLLD